MSHSPVTATGRDLDTIVGDEPLYAEDLRPDDWMDLGSVSVTRDQIIAFAEEYDPLPIHVDPEAAARSPFGDVIAAASHTLALYSSMASRRFTPRLALVAGKGIDALTLPNPVRPDAVLRGRMVVQEVRLGTRRAQVACHAVMWDERDDVVLDFHTVHVVWRKDVA